MICVYFFEEGCKINLWTKNIQSPWENCVYHKFYTEIKLLYGKWDAFVCNRNWRDWNWTIFQTKYNTCNWCSCPSCGLVFEYSLHTCMAARPTKALTVSSKVDSFASMSRRDTTKPVSSRASSDCRMDSLKSGICIKLQPIPAHCVPIPVIQVTNQKTLMQQNQSLKTLICLRS